MTAGCGSAPFGWTAKSTPFEDMARTVGAAARGDDALDPAERTRLVNEQHTVDRERRELDRRWCRLTSREREIVRCLAAGKRVADIAEEYVVFPATVRTQVRSILAKLEVTSQLEAAAIARRIERAPPSSRRQRCQSTRRGFEPISAVAGTRPSPCDLIR